MKPLKYIQIILFNIIIYFFIFNFFWGFAKFCCCFNSALQYSTTSRQSKASNTNLAIRPAASRRCYIFAYIRLYIMHIYRPGIYRLKIILRVIYQTPKELGAIFEIWPKVPKNNLTYLFQ